MQLMTRMMKLFFLHLFVFTLWHAHGLVMPSQSAVPIPYTDNIGSALSGDELPSSTITETMMAKTSFEASASDIQEELGKLEQDVETVMKKLRPTEDDPSINGMCAFDLDGFLFEFNVRTLYENEE